MKPVVFLMMLVVVGCASRPESISVFSAVVRSYGEVVTLGTPIAERTYVAELAITAPPGLERRIVSVSSKEPLPPAHLFRKTGAHLRLSVVSLESGRGTSLVPAEGITRITYQMTIESVMTVAEEPNQPTGPKPLAVTPHATAHVAQSSGAAHQ